MITGAIALPLLVFLILKGSLLVFSCFVVLLSLLGLGEFYRMALPERRIEGVAASFFGAFIPIVLVAPELILRFLPLPNVPSVPVFILTAFFVVFGILILFRVRDIKLAAGETAFLGMGIVYVPILLTHLVWLRALPHGIEWIFLLLLIVMSGDTGAYYVGCNFGKRKLYPIVSPNKSIEGAVGGLFGSIVGAFVAKLTFFPGLAVIDCIVTALVMGPLGQVGDLFESLLKRSFGVKDSGVIVPGHGGILDRLDSILFAAPAAYYYACFFFLNR